VTHRRTRRALPARQLLATLVAGLALTGTAWAEDRAAIDTTQIVGNRELPKVLYIVPWKKPSPSDLEGRVPSSLMDEVLAPIDRDVFRRQIKLAESRAGKGAEAPEAARP
jgi:hypothetical protein